MLRDCIIGTLAYFDCFDIPLTEDDIRTHLETLAQPFSSEEFDQTIDQLVNDQVVIRSRGYIIFPYREHIVPVFLRRQNISQKKLLKARRIARLLSCIPYVEGIFASGSIADHNADHEGDLDLFIIVKYGHIWTARLLATLMTALIGARRTGHDIIAPNKACLNHFATDQSLLFPYQNMFSARVCEGLLPLYLSHHEMMQQFKDENNWTKLYIAHWTTDYSMVLNSSRAIRGIRKILRIGMGPVTRMFEQSAREYQLDRIQRNPKTSHPNGRLTYTDYRLQFHPDSIESDILRRYAERRQDIKG